MHAPLLTTQCIQRPASPLARVQRSTDRRCLMENLLMRKLYTHALIDARNSIKLMTFIATLLCESTCPFLCFSTPCKTIKLAWPCAFFLLPLSPSSRRQCTLVHAVASNACQPLVQWYFAFRYSLDLVIQPHVRHNPPLACFALQCFYGRPARSILLRNKTTNSNGLFVVCSFSHRNDV